MFEAASELELEKKVGAAFKNEAEIRRNQSPTEVVETLDPASAEEKPWTAVRPP